jgi:hypothetical protein
MLVIGKTLVSDELLTERFVCHIEACKAACCVEGDGGAPLLEEEAGILEEIYPLVAPFLSEKGKASIEEQGKWVTDKDDGEKCTPLVNHRECAYALWDEKGILHCGIEKAYEAGAVTFRKPSSCHLYPVRVKEHKEFTAVNYHRWHICQPACALGTKLGVPVFRFLKEALINRFGDEWYAELEVLAAHAEGKGLNYE